MTDSDRRLLEDSLTAQVLCLASLMRVEKWQRGTQTTGEFIREATDQVKREREMVLKLLKEG